MIFYGFEILDLRRIELSVFEFKSGAIHLFEELDLSGTAYYSTALPWD